VALIESTLLAKCKLWLRADSAILSTDGHVTTWPDCTGNGNNFTGVNPTYPPLTLNVLNGRPYVDFTSGKILTGPTITNFLDNNSAFVVVLFKADSIATNDSTNNNNNDAIMSGSTNQAIGLNLRNTSPPRIVSYNNDGAQEATFTTITLGTWTVGFYIHAGGSLVSQTDPFTVNSTASGNTVGAGAANLGQNYNGAHGYTGQLAELFAGNGTLTETDKATFSNYLNAKWLTRGDSVEQARYNASERIFLNGRPFGYVTAPNLPSVVADIELGTDISISHPQWPHPAGLGAANSRWERAPVRTMVIDEDMDNDTVTLEGVLLRNRVVTYLETCEPSSLSTRRHGGIVTVSPIGAARSFTRNSKAYGLRPTDSLIASVPTSEEVWEVTNGFLLEDSENNLLANPVFATAALSSWTTTPGTGGATVASEVTTTPFWVDSTLSANNCKFTQGSPAGADNILQQNIAAGISGQHGVLAIRHRDDSGAQLFWRISRASDSKTWDDSAQAWSGSLIDNGLTISTSMTREYSHVIDFSTSTTYTLTIRQKSGGTASRVNRVYEVMQGQLLRHKSSPIIHANAIPSGTERQACLTFIPNNSGARVLNAAKGCMKACVAPHWNSAELAGTERQTIFECYYDTNNWFRGYYDAATLSWVMEGRVSGTTYKATYAASVTRDTEVQFGGRWTGVEAEENLSAYTLSVFVSGVKGTDATMSGTPVETTNSNLYVGTPSVNVSAVIGTCINGYLRRKIEFRPVVYSDTEMAVSI